MLNHFQMAVPIACCGLFLLLSDRRAFAVYFASVVLAAGVFLAIDPYALGSLAFNAKVNTYEAITARSVVVRGRNVAVGLMHFFAIEPKWTRAVTLLVPLAIAVAWAVGRGRVADAAAAGGRAAGPGPDVEALPPRGRSPLATFGRLTLLLLALDVAMYMTWLLPFHAYGAYYFPGLITLTAVWLGVALRRVVRRPAAVVCVLVVMLAASLGSARRQVGLYAEAAAATAALARADVILTDAVHVHGVPRIVDPARPDAWVLATSRPHLTTALEEALAAGRRVVLALDVRPESHGPDALDARIADATAQGRLVAQGGLVPFSPEFTLFRVPD